MKGTSPENMAGYSFGKHQPGPSLVIGQPPGAWPSRLQLFQLIPGKPRKKERLKIASVWTILDF